MRAARARLLAAAVLLAWCQAARAGSLDVPVDYQGRQITLPGVLEMPSGAGPFPAVILLHGCGGNDYYAQNRSEMWGAQLRGAGYATLIIDSFAPRGYTSVCNNVMLMLSAERAKDVYAAADALSRRDDIRHDRIAAMGFSHGGTTVVFADAAAAPRLEDWRHRLADHAKIAAFVAFYPGCRDNADQNFLAPLLILTGGNDDWSVPEPCRRLGDKERPGGAEVKVKIYPGAVHDFDYNVPAHMVAGHHLAYDAEAAQDAHAEVAAFLKRYLQ